MQAVAMNAPDKNHNALKGRIRALRSGNRPVIISTLRELRNSGNVSVLPELFELLAGQEDEQIAGEICNLLNDLKDQKAAGLLADAIQNPDYRSVSISLVAACWQNGLSYGDHIETFVEVVLTGPYQAAIEAFTVIEGAIGEIGLERRDRLKSELVSRVGEEEPLKRPPVNKLVRVIESY